MKRKQDLWKNCLLVLFLTGCAEPAYLATELSPEAEAVISALETVTGMYDHNAREELLRVQVKDSSSVVENCGFDPKKYCNFSEYEKGNKECSKYLAGCYTSRGEGPAIFLEDSLEEEVRYFVLIHEWIHAAWHWIDRKDGNSKHEEPWREVFDLAIAKLDEGEHHAAVIHCREGALLVSF